jgi:SHS2 domain-containing protein
MPPFEEIDHTADWAFRVRSDSREGLFHDAAEALYSLGGVQTGAVWEETPREIRLQADDLEGLLVQWLNEILFLLDHDRLALDDIRIERLTDTELAVTGRPVGVTAVGKYIKAATYSGLRISHKDEIWEATLVIDV